MPGTPTKHTAFIFDRGGTTRLFQIRRPTEITYTRVRDDTSEGEITVDLEEFYSQRFDLAGVEPGRHELHIFRGDKKAWEGPVNLPASMSDGFAWNCTAKDVTLYLDRRVIEGAYDNSGSKSDYVVSRLEEILRNELADKEGLGYNLLGHLHFYVSPGDARTTAVTAAYSMSVFDHLDDLAAKAGIDYTVVGRELHIWDTSRAAMGTTPVVGRNDFTSEPTIKKYGAELATRVIATDGQGGYGIAGGLDPYYGEWDIISQAYDEDTDAELPTQDELNSQASLGLNGRNPTPLKLGVPQNSSLSPSSALTWDMLTPGAYVPLRLDLGGRYITRMQKLDSVKVTDNADGEQIQLSLYPASGIDSDDATIGGVE